MKLRAGVRLGGRVPLAPAMVVALLLGGGAYYLAWYRPVAVRTAAMLAEASRLEAEVQVLSRARLALPEAERALQALRARQARAAERTPRVEDLPRGAGFVSRAAEVAGLRPLRVTYSLQGPAAPAPDAKAAAGGGSVRFDVEVEGPYGGLVSLVETMERAFEGVQFISLAVSPAPPPEPARLAAHAPSQAQAQANVPFSPLLGQAAGQAPGGTQPGVTAGPGAGSEAALSDRLSQVAALFSYLQMLAMQQSGAVTGVPVGQPAGPLSPSAASGSPAPEVTGSPAVRASLSFTVAVRAADDPVSRAVEWKALPLPVASTTGGTSNPFEPSDRTAVEARLAQAPSPEVPALRVTGIARGSDGFMAVLVVDERSHLVRDGTRLGRLTVRTVRAGGVDVQVEGRRVFVPLRVEP
ncbi:hypothetical protein U7230_09620 [Carboxydochorda subterranea]|uniref:Tfp pilus assembly protein PilO n=1 Tax=Carboxydichorda subterranea TaxID=3109565 RepID=A0ABZ1BV36_9FIRM|nr:hypothetical protein [Limnochorda sp. L945t]WRP16355.1 hypothetical protein U7230_09620 [Limnochorda sp. L945t]